MLLSDLHIDVEGDLTVSSRCSLCALIRFCFVCSISLRSSLHWSVEICTVCVSAACRCSGRSLRRFARNDFIGRYGIDHRLVLAVQDRFLNELCPLRVLKRSHAALRRQNVSVLCHRRCSVLIEDRNNSLACCEVQQELLCVEFRIDSECLSCSLDYPLLCRSVCVQAVLDLVSELCHYCIRNVSRALRNEENGYALGSYELDDLLDLLEEALARVLEEKMRFVKEEYHLRLFRIAYLRQHLEELGQQVQHEC